MVPVEHLLPLLVILVFVLIFYLLIDRPQRRSEERRALMLSSVKKGSVVYAGGIRCTVLDFDSGRVLAASGPSRSALEIDADAIDDVEGFDYRAEYERQKKLRRERAARGGGLGRR